MQVNLNSIDEFHNFITSNPGAVVYFSTPQCNVCKVLKPKLISLLEENFPNMSFGYVDCESQKELAAQNRIFAVPTILFLLTEKNLSENHVT